MANTGFKGIDVRQSATLVFDEFLQNLDLTLCSTGTTTLYLTELQSDGTIKTFDFNDNTFKTGAVTTETLAMTYRKSNNAATDTGLWTAVVSTVTGFTVGAIYQVRVHSTVASPPDRMRKFQFGSSEGDMVSQSGDSYSFLPHVTPGQSGGLLVLGVNSGSLTILSGVTFTNSSGAGFTCTSSGGNGSGIVANGQGAGDGISATGGAGGRGIHALGSSEGILGTGGSTSAGISGNLGAPRDMSALTDAAFTINDAYWAAIEAGPGQKDASSGTSMVHKTPADGTLLRTFAITTATAPTTVPTKIV